MQRLTRGWAFKVYGDPQPKGSMKCIGARGTRGHQLIEDNKDSGPWMDKIRHMALGPALGGVVGESAAEHQAVMVEITSTLPRPKSHYGTGRNEHTVKDSAPEWPTKHGTGDVDKLARLVLDGLETSGTLLNDAQVVEVRTYKCYPGSTAALARGYDVLDRPGVVVRVRPVD